MASFGGRENGHKYPIRDPMDLQILFGYSRCQVPWTYKKFKNFQSTQVWYTKNEKLTDLELFQGLLAKHEATPKFRLTWGIILSEINCFSLVCIFGLLVVHPNNV